MRQDKTCLDHYEFETGMKLCILPKFKVQGQRDRGAGELGKWFSTFSPFFHRVTRPRHPHIFNHPCQLIDLTLSDSTDNFIFPFSSPALVMNAFRFYMMAAYVKYYQRLWTSKRKSRKKNWSQFDFPSTFMNQVWNEQYWFFWLLHNVLMSWLCVLHPPSPIHPFSSCITHQLQSLNITLYSHPWWTCMTKKEKRTTTTTTRRCRWCFAYVCSAYEWKLLVKLKYTETFSERLDLTILECSGPKESQDYWMHYPVRWVLLSVLSIFEACLSWRESSVLGSASGY